MKEQYDKAALKQLGLPVDPEGFSLGLLRAYGTVAQYLNAVIRSRPLTTVTRFRPDEAFQQLYQALEMQPPIPGLPASPAEANQVLAALRREPRLRRDSSLLNRNPAVQLLIAVEQSMMGDAFDPVRAVVSADLRFPDADDRWRELADGDFAVLWALPLLGDSKGRCTPIFRVDFEVESGQVRIDPSVRAIFNPGIFRLEAMADLDPHMDAIDRFTSEPLPNDLGELARAVLGAWRAATGIDLAVLPNRVSPKLGAVGVFIVPHSKLPGSPALRGLRDLAALPELPTNCQQVLTVRGRNSPQSVQSDAMKRPLPATMDSRTAAGRVTFPLDPYQRLAARAAVAMMSADSAVQAINGPPGSGKTAFLRSVVASLWVDAAARGLDAPLRVVGTGVTNKAVANMIEAFSGIADETTGAGSAITARWIPGLPSYGWVLPSQSAEAGAAHLMQLKQGPDRQFMAAGRAGEFGEQLVLGVDGWIEYYLACAMGESGEDRTLQATVDQLRQRLVRLQDQMAQQLKTVGDLIERVRYVAANYRRAVLQRDALPTGSPTVHMELVNLHQQASERLAQALEAQRAAKRAETALRRIESQAWYAPVVRWWNRRERQGLEVALQQAQFRFRDAVDRLVGASGRNSGHSRAVDPLDAEARFVGDLGAQVATSQAVFDARAKADQEVDSHREAVALWSEKLKEALPETLSDEVAGVAEGDAEAGPALLLAVDTLLDESHRVPSFHLAARYWEGRFLLRRLAGARGGLSAVARPALDADEVRMLGLIVVGTTHQLYRLATAQDPADLAILDEAGQATSSLGLALVGAARHALLVGDTAQLAPITGATHSLVEAKAAQLDFPLASLPPGMDPVTGSALMAVQPVSFASDGSPQPGITLRNHYRCHPTIIGFCNELSYGGQIIPSRLLGLPGQETPAQALGIPEMGWVDCRGVVEKVGGSSINPQQAAEAIEWVAENAEALKAAYQKPLGKIVALLAPFSAMADRLRREARAKLGEDAADMVIGTVHALQGAERPVVLFCLTQFVGPDGVSSLFVDKQGPSILNVAVSRAQDAFIVIGDRHTLRPTRRDQQKPGLRASRDGPVGRLGRYLARHGRALYPNSLFLIEAGGKESAFRKLLGKRHVVIATQGSFDNSTWNGKSLDWQLAPNGVELKSRLEDLQGVVQRVMVATDDDIAGELIAYRIYQRFRELFPVPFLRVRIHAIEAEPVRQALARAEPELSRELLGSALRREIARHVDREQLPKTVPYQSPGVRWLVKQVADHPLTGVAVHVRLASAEGQWVGTFYNDRSLLTEAVVDPEQARNWMRYLASSPEKPSMERANGGTLRVTRVAPLYPPSTTARILSQASWQLGMTPWDTRDVLQGLYLNHQGGG